ncbi:MAG: type II toxin-antitoxin system VapC family toxin [Acidimicrobiia bacterium]
MTVAYVESSALVKLAVAEPETPDLKGALGAHDRIVSSDLGAIEATRAAWRRDGDSGAARARAALLRIFLIPIDRPVIDVACRLATPTLRSLDAIHIATALGLIADGVTFYSYDQRALDAARAAGLSVASP